MKSLLVVLLSLSVAQAASIFEYEESATRFDLESATNEVVVSAENACRIHGVKGTVTRISDFEITDIPEQDFSSDPKCEWRGSCYMPAQVNVIAKFRCEF